MNLLLPDKYLPVEHLNTLDGSGRPVRSGRVLPPYPPPSRAPVPVVRTPVRMPASLPMPPAPGVGAAIDSAVAVEVFPPCFSPDGACCLSTIAY